MPVYHQLRPHSRPRSLPRASWDDEKTREQRRKRHRALRESDEEREQRRLRKRLAAVQAVRSSWEFVALAADASRDGEASLPEQPDPHITALSKRQWEAAIQQWRRRIREDWEARGYWEA